jgi:hypothetical protein
MKKILFYGNCQLGALSKHIREHSNNYHILDCRDYGLKQFWLDSGLFATWSPDNKDNHSKYYPQIIEAVKACDIFIFQHHTHLVRRTELTTEYLVNQLRPASVSICLPSIRYYGYLYDDSRVNYVVKKLYEQKMLDIEILSYLQHEDDNDAKRQMIENHYSSLEKLKQKDKENIQLYKNYIPMSNFIESNYQNKIIAYDHSHPSTHYYNEIIKKLVDYDIKINQLFNNESTLPRSAQLCPYDLKYFHNHFPELEDTEQHDSFFSLRLNAASIQHQIALIKDKGNIQ